MKPLLLLFLLSICFIDTQSQTIPTKEELVGYYGFVEEKIQRQGEEITYYLYQPEQGDKSKLVLYLQGSDPSPQFSYRIKNGEVKRFCWLHGEFQELSDEYLYVVVEKVGFEGLIDEDEIPLPKIYQEKNSLGDRVFRANEVINYLNTQHSFNQVIVYGHSEGAPVAAKLGTVNQQITHLGFWAGNALPDFYDFVLESRIQFHKGEISAEESHKQINKTLKGFVDQIAKDTAKTQAKGYTNKRWWSYAEPPLYNLLKLDIPVFVQVASNDASAPIESTYLIPLEFARKGKANLTYKVCVGCDHGFTVKQTDGQTIRKWKNIFVEFIEWAQETKVDK